MSACQDATEIQHVLRWHQEPNSEIQQCHIFKLDNADPVEVDQISVEFAAGSHHVHIYRSDIDSPDEVSDCWNGIDWTRWNLLIGAQTKPIDWQLRTGPTVPLAPHQQLLVQVHWLNTTPSPVDEEIKITFHTTDQSTSHVGVVFGINKQTAMQPHEHKVLRQWCAMPSGTELLALMGHFHALGQRYSIDARAENATTGTSLYEALDEQTFQFKVFDPARPLVLNDGLQFECDFFNYHDYPITWGANTKTMEHCNMVAYYYPAEELSKFCMIEATEVSAIDGPAGMVPAGAAATYTVHLTAAAPTGGATVELSASDPTALEVPETAFVPEGATSTVFTARALRPRRVEVSAKLGSTSKTVTTRVGGLLLSEVFTGTATNKDRRQWVEIANLTDVAIDLSKFSLGGGWVDYTKTRVKLTATVPPHGCVVIGGPLLTTSTQPPYSQAIDFSPDLGLPTATAYGLALFDVEADRINSNSLPYDTLVYGIDNNVLPDPSGALSEVIKLAPDSGSYVRTSPRWTTQTVPTPGICEVP